MLGVRAAIGRTFVENDDRQDGNVVVLTWSMFERRYGGDTSIVGPQIHLDGTPVHRGGRAAEVVRLARHRKPVLGPLSVPGPPRRSSTWPVWCRRAESFFAQSSLTPNRFASPSDFRLRSHTPRRTFDADRSNMAPASG